MVQILKIVFIIIGTFVGAGFASGKEIYVFFYKYKIYGIFGIFISSIFIGITIYKSIIISKKNNIENFDNFLDFIIKKNKVKIILKNIINIFFVLSFCVMISGFCSFIKQEFYLNNYLSYFFIIFICSYIFLRDIYGLKNKKTMDLIMKINNIIIPFIIFFVIYFFIISIKNNNLNNIYLIQNNKIQLFNYFNIISKIKNNFFISSLLYASYNLLSIIPISITLAKLVKNKKNTKIICLISSLIIIILSLSIFFILNTGNNNMLNLDLPVVSIIGNSRLIYKYIYCIIIGCAIITTAISVGYAYLQKYNKNKKNYIAHFIILIFFTIISGGIGFSNLIEILYPIFGFIGMIISIFIL